MLRDFETRPTRNDLLLASTLRGLKAWYWDLHDPIGRWCRRNFKEGRVDWKTGEKSEILGNVCRYFLEIYGRRKDRNHGHLCIARYLRIRRCKRRHIDN